MGFWDNVKNYLIKAIEIQKEENKRRMLGDAIDINNSEAVSFEALHEESRKKLERLNQNIENLRNSIEQQEEYFQAQEQPMSDVTDEYDVSMETYSASCMSSAYIPSEDLLGTQRKKEKEKEERKKRWKLINIEIDEKQRVIRQKKE